MNQFTANQKAAIKQELHQIEKHSSLASSTLRSRISALNTLLDEVGSFDLELISQWLQGKINSQSGAKLSGHGKNRYIISLKWYLKHTKLIFGASELYLQLKKYPTPKSPGKAIKDDQFETVIQYAPDDLHDLAFRCLYETAMRPHELLSIRWCDITFHSEFGGYAMISLQDENPTTPSGKNKTGGRIIYIKDQYQGLYSLFQEQKWGTEVQKDSQVFPWNHQHLSRIFIGMKNMAKAIESEGGSRNKGEHGNELFQFRLYDLRHTAITRMYAKGIPDQIIRKAVGWAPASKMPNTYVHIQTAQLVEKFIECLGDSKGPVNLISLKIGPQGDNDVKNAQIKSIGAFIEYPHRNV